MNIARRLFISAQRPTRLQSLAYLRCRRTFSFTPHLRAAENDDTFLTQLKNSSLFQKLADKPEALIALRDFANFMRDQGIDTTSGPPSTMQMMRLAANSEFRQAAQKVVEELKNAGVDLTSQDTMQELMGLSKGKPGGQ